MNPPTHPGRFISLHWLLALVLLTPLLLPPRPTQAQAPGDVVISARTNAVPSFDADDASILIDVAARFWSRDQHYTISDLTALAPNFSLDSDALRGFTFLVAIPAGTLPVITEQLGRTYTLSLDPDLAAGSLAQTGPAAQIVGDPFWLRDQYVVRLRVWPMRRDNATNEAILIPDLQLRLAIIGRWPKLVPVRPDPHWEPILQNVLLNYKQSRAWRQPPAFADVLLDGPAPASSQGDFRVRIGVTETGLHRLDYDDLAGLGLDLENLDPRTLQLYMGAQPVPIRVEGEEDGRFEAGDGLVFYAPPWTSRSAREHIYWLTVVEGEGQRVAGKTQANEGLLVPAYEDTVHREQQNIYISDMPLSDAADHWYWMSIIPARTGAGRRTIHFDLYPAVWGPVNARLRVRLLGRDAGAAAVKLYFNGYELDGFVSEDQDIVEFETSFPHFSIREGDNEVVVEVMKQGDKNHTVVLDWIELTYVRSFQAGGDHLRFHVDWPGVWRVRLDGFENVPMIWDVTDPLQPVMVEGLDIGAQVTDGYSVEFVSDSAMTPIYEAVAPAAFLHPASVTLAPPPTDLLDPANRADYLIITSAALAPAAQRLAAHRSSQDLAARVVDIADIYENFNAGQADPEAIRAFLLYALANWQTPAPAYVVLFGDAHYDPLAYIVDTPVQVPVNLQVADPWLGEVADENRYAAVIGQDIVPDIMLGRLPVQTQEQADLIVDKLIAYDVLETGQEWQRHMLIVADDPDSAGDFYALAAHMDDLVGSTLSTSRYFLGSTHASAAALRQDLLNVWSKGAFIVNYVGHGQPDTWAGERILTVSDLAQLQNQGRPAVLLAMASLTGIFYWPNGLSLQDSMLFLPDGRGVIGYVASTGYGLASGNALVNEGFLNAVVYERTNSLGAATLSGKLHLYAQGYSYTEFLTRLYTLVGDPATRMPVEPWSQTLYLPRVSN